MSLSTGMLTLTLLLMMAVAIAVLVVLVIYLVDRFNGLERDTKQVLQNLQQPQQAKFAGPYAGLSGKPLWDAVAGDPPAGMDELTLDGLRKRYRLLLGEHLSFIFNEGVSDQGKGFDAVPANTRMVRTPRTQVESWIPPEAVETIYRCGQGYARYDPAEVPGLRQNLDQVCAQLHMQAGLEMLQPASSLLMPPRPQPEAAVGGGETSEPQA